LSGGPAATAGNGEGVEEVEMYGNELTIDNASDQDIEVRIRKRKSPDDLVSEILCNEKPVNWATEAERLSLASGSGRTPKTVSA